MGRRACRACGTGRLLLQWGSLLQHRCPLLHSSICTPPSPMSSSLCNSPFSHPPPALSHPCFLLPLSILSSHLSLQCPAPKMLLQHCSHPQSKGEACPCPPRSAPRGCPTALARMQPMGLGHPVPQSQPPTSWLSREEDETKTCQTIRPPPEPRTTLLHPSPSGHEARWARAEHSPAWAAQQCCAGTCHSQRDIPEASKCCFSHSRWQILQQGGEAGCPSAPPAIALTLHLPFQGWEPAPGSQTLPSTTLLSPAPDIPKDTPRGRDQPLPPVPSPLHPGPSATAPGGSIELKQKRTLTLKKIIILE